MAPEFWFRLRLYRRSRPMPRRPACRKPAANLRGLHASVGANQLSVFLDLILELRVDTHNYAIPRLDARKSGFESRIERFGRSRHPPRRQNLECEAGFSGLAHHGEHALWISFEVKFVGRQGKLAEQLADLIGGASAIISATHVEIHVPAVFLDVLDDLRLVRGNACQHAGLARALRDD